MSDPQILTSEISEIGFSTEPPSISFVHNGEKYWLYTGGDSKDFTSGLELFSQLRHSAIVAPDDSGSVTNGYHILRGISLTAHPEISSYVSYTFTGLLALIAILLLLITIRLYRPVRKAD